MKFREVISKLVLPSALVAIGSYIFIVFVSSWWLLVVKDEPPDALLDLFVPTVIVCVLSSGIAVCALGVRMKCSRIRIAAAVLGVVGGVTRALIMPIPWLLIVWNMIEHYSIPWLFAVEPLVSLMAIGGGIFALRRRGMGGLMLLVAFLILMAIGGGIFAMGIVGGIFALRRPGVGGLMLLGATIVATIVATGPMELMGLMIRGLLALASALASLGIDLFFLLHLYPLLLFLGGLLALASVLASQRKRP